LEWAQVRTLMVDGLSEREIARRLGINRRTVARLAASDEPPRYRRASVGSQLARGVSCAQTSSRLELTACGVRKFGRLIEKHLICGEDRVLRTPQVCLPMKYRQLMPQHDDLQLLELG